MAVEFFSYGYDTVPGEGLSETIWQDMHPVIGLATYGVRSPLDWKVTAVTGADRTVSIAAGRGFGLGVIDKTVDNDTIQLDPIASGSRWDLIAVRRDPTPTAGVSEFIAISGGSTPVIPGGRLVGPGIHDQPLALVRVTAGQTQPAEFIDLRTWVGDGGGLVANHDLVRSFLNKTGTRLLINGTDWVRRVGLNDTPEWASSTAPVISAGQADKTPVIKAENRVFPVTNSLGDVIYTFPTPFPNAITAVTVTDAQSLGGFGVINIKIINELTDKTRICLRFRDSNGNALVGLTLKASYIAVGY